MSTTVPLLTNSSLKVLALSQVFCTALLTSFSLFSEPDVSLLLLLALCMVGNYSWQRHLDAGWGSDGAVWLFRAALLVNAVGLVAGIYRRVKHPEFVDRGSDKVEEEGWEKRYDERDDEFGGITEKEEVAPAGMGGGVERRALGANNEGMGENKGRVRSPVRGKKEKGKGEKMGGGGKGEIKGS